MHLIDSVLQLLQVLRDSQDFFYFHCRKENRIGVRFPDIPHEVITHLLYNIRFMKSDKCDLNFLFLEFIRLGYNPFRKDASLQESVMIKSIVSIIDKQRLNNGNRFRNVSKKKTP